MASEATITASMDSYNVEGGMVIFVQIGDVPNETSCERLLRVINALQGTYAELCPILQPKSKPAKNETSCEQLLRDANAWQGMYTQPKRKPAKKKATRKK